MTAETRDRLMMTRCIELAKASVKAGEYPYAAVLCRGDTVVAESINRVTHDRDVTRHAEVVVGHARRDAAARGALQEADLQQVRLVHVHDGVRLLGHGRGERLEARGTAVEALDQHAQQLAVHAVQAERVDLQLRERGLRERTGDHAVAFDLRVVAQAAQQAIGDARGAARAARDLAHAVFVHRAGEHAGGAAHDLR